MQGWTKSPPRKFFANPGKVCWTSFKTIGHSSKNLGPLQKTLRPSWCPKLATGLLLYLAIAANEAFFCDCYRNMEHFLCSVERIKRFLNVHLHCIVSNVPYKMRKYSGPPELLRSEISFSSTCNIPKQWKLHRKQEAI